MSSNELWSRVEAEAPNFQADVIWGFMNMQAMIGAAKDWFMPYNSPAWKEIPIEFKDPDGLWYGFNYWFAAAVVNTDLLKKKNLPKPVSWADMINPVYKGELVMPNPGTSGTAFLSVSAMMQIFGEEKGWELLDGMNKNTGQYTKSGSAPAKLVANGEYALGISWDHAIFSRVEEGFPIEGIIPSEGTAYDLDSVAILKGCKNLEAAKKLIDWIASKEAMEPVGQTLSKVTLPGVSGKVKLMPKLIKYNAVWPGVILAQVITFLPLGYLMIENVLRSLGTKMEDAAMDMRASDYDILFKITIPLSFPGILKAALLVFLMSIADFGNPMLISGNVHFLATDAYLYWISKNNLEMAAVFCVFLIIPSMLMFVIHEFILKGKSFTTIGGKPQLVEERPISSKILYPMLFVVGPVSALIVACFGMIFLGAFTKILMTNNTFTLEHFSSPNGIRALVTSLKFALSAACIAPLIGVTLSYIFIRKRIPFKKALEFLALLGFAVPGTVMGVGYILAFNAPPIKLTGTFIIMIINEAFRNLSVSLEAGSSKLHQIDVAIEEAAFDMGAGAMKTFFKIVLPLISSALLAGFIYTFMVGMIAVSAVIFLISPGNNLAALYILAVAEQGMLGMACAISVMLIGVVLICLGALKLVGQYTRTEIY